jgi:hypothetical protein
VEYQVYLKILIYLNIIMNCKFCNVAFTRKDSLIKHLKDNRCDVAKNMTPLDYHNKFEELLNKLVINGNNNHHIALNSNNTVTNNINFNIQIQPITKLSLEHISPDRMKQVIETYDNDKTKLNFLLTEYLNGVLCDQEHPENHAVKYTRKYPPTFNSITEDAAGNIITTIKGLKDTCEVLSDPVLDVLKVKLCECIKKYKRDDNINYDYSLYEDAIRELRKELKKDNIKKVLSNFLKNDLINNIEMKLSMSSEHF